MKQGTKPADTAAVKSADKAADKAAAKTRAAGPSLASRMRTAHHERLRAIELAQKRMSRSFPRLQMSLIIALTGGSGLLASFLLLRGGLDSMAVRYPLSVVIAYVIFLGLLWLWLRTTTSDYVDAIPADLPLPTGGSVDISMPFRGGGGDFGGAGASASFDGGTQIGDAVSKPLEWTGKAAGRVASAVDVDLDEGVVPLVAIVVAIAFAVVLISAAFYVIYIAPVLLAEVVVDGALSYALYRRLKLDDSHHWLVSACRRTALPFAATAILLALIGVGMSMYAPGARSVGEVVRYVAPPK